MAVDAGEHPRARHLRSGGGVRDGTGPGCLGATSGWLTREGLFEDMT